MKTNINVFLGSLLELNFPVYSYVYVLAVKAFKRLTNPASTLKEPLCVLDAGTFDETRQHSACCALLQATPGIHQLF